MSYIDHLCGKCNHRRCEHLAGEHSWCACCRVNREGGPDLLPPQVLPSWDADTRELMPLQAPGTYYGYRYLCACDACQDLYAKEMR